jgi:hypothetical protein
MVMRTSVHIYVKLLSAAFLLMVLTSCTKWHQERNDLPYITFGVSGLDIQTKALITDFTAQNITLYGVKNNTTPLFTKATLIKGTGNNWTTDPQKQWEAGSSYSFYAHTHSPASPQNSATISVKNSGLEIDVSQPSIYSETDMVDYMLSHAYKVADGKNYHTVILYMQHAMSWIEVVVEKEDIGHTILLKNISLSNIYRTANMKCDAQAVALSGYHNLWNTTLIGSNNTTYTKNTFTPDETLLGKMSILAVPQQLSAATTLTISYSVIENGGTTKDYTETFNLYNYNPYVWESGNKITYTLTINTGVQLKAHIDDWTESGYIEGIIIPN